MVDGWAVLDLPPILFIKSKYIAGALRPYIIKKFAFSKLDSLIPMLSPILHPLFKAFYRSHADLNTIS